MPSSLSAKSHRIASIDIVRGIVMVIMALDHTREFFHYGALTGNDPLDFATTTPAVFLTRWVTHFCAPVFVFLSGTSIYLYAQRVKSKNELAGFLFTRGLWLVIAEVIVVSGLWSFSYFKITMLQVFYAIGMSMMVMSLLQYLPRKLVLMIGLLVVFGHNALAGLQPGTGVTGIAWSLMFTPNLFQAWQGYIILLGYPFVPWLGLMICGYALGSLYDADVDARYRRRFLWVAGLIAIGLFIVLRVAGIYGDRNAWEQQSSPVFTFLDFVNTTKYPPSLQFDLMTIGPALLALAFTEGLFNRFTKIVVVYGRVPFVYYMMHVLLIHLLAVINATVTGHGSGMPVLPGLPVDPAAGYPLWIVYLIWMFVVVVLYFPSRWYGNYRRNHPEVKWLRYL